MFIVFLGVDGSGKSTLIKMLSDYIVSNHGDTAVRCFHFCATSKYNKPGTVAVSSPQGKPSYGILKNLSKDIFLLANFLFGYWRIKGITSKGGIVFLDRYYYDVVIDPARFRLKNYKFRRIFLKLLPLPDLLFFCRGDSADIANRKPELSVQEIDRQQTVIMQTLKSLKSLNWVLIDTTKNNPEDSLSLIRQNLSL